MPPVVLALGFDLFFRPKLAQAAKEAGVELRAVAPAQAVEAAAEAARVVADVSAPGVQEALEAVRAARPDLEMLACYPHVEAARARAAEALGARTVTRGAFNGDLVAALQGKL